MEMPCRSFRYSGSERPAWRMNHTGVCGTASRRQARRKAESWVAVGGPVGRSSALTPGSLPRAHPRSVSLPAATAPYAYSRPMTAARTHLAGGSGDGEGQGGTAEDGDGAPLPFRQAVAALQVTPHRPEVHIGTLPAPKRLAPYAHALEVTVDEDGGELADGRFVLLHDPEGQEPWEGTFRIVTLGRTELDAEMAADPVLPDVTWTWLTGALEAHGVRYGAPSGTVTRSGSTFFGGLADRAPHTDLEVRASWTPAAAERGEDGTGVPDAGAHLLAWCELLCQCAGLPPADGDDGAVVALPQRRGPRSL